ncbi:MAG: TIGR03118 family protein [Steroidobacteraceae bacterium]
MRHTLSFTRAVAALCLLGGTAAAILTACGGGGYGGGSGGTPPASVTFSVMPTSIAVGQSATLTWSTNGTACTASGAWTGMKPASGTQSVSPSPAGTYTYTLVCSGGAYGMSTTYNATLTVTAMAASMGSSAFTVSALMSDGSVMAAATDKHLVNPWGLAFAPNAPVRVANNGTQTSTRFEGSGVHAPALAVPAGLSGSANPTGLVFNGTTDFVVTHDGASAPATFIFAGEGGTIAAWAPSVDATRALIVFDDGAGGAVFTGLAIANNGSANLLYAADFHNNAVDVFDSTFAKVTTAGGFRDAALPAGFAPFGIQAVRIHNQTLIYVTYARQLAGTHNSADGAGLGLVNVFDTHGTLLKHLIGAGGALNAPWGIALAPANFGSLGDALLIGNSGDGVINAFDAMSGAFIGSVSDATGRPIATPGLRGIAFGNGAANQPATALFFAAGIARGADGVFGRIDLGN